MLAPLGKYLWASIHRRHEALRGSTGDRAGAVDNRWCGAGVERRSRGFGWRFTRPGAALLSSATAQSFGIANNTTLRLRIGTNEHDAILIGLLEPEDANTRRALDGILVTDIATAQEWFSILGELQRQIGDDLRNRF